jgi:hypothetical protein
VTALVLGALLAAAAVALVALPFFLSRGDEPDELGEATEHRLALIDERDRALAALRELEFDHRAGTIDDEEYRALVAPLRRAAAEALQALDADTSQE